MVYIFSMIIITVIFSIWTERCSQNYFPVFSKNIIEACILFCEKKISCHQNFLMSVCLLYCLIESIFAHMMATPKSSDC